MHDDFNQRILDFLEKNELFKGVTPDQLKLVLTVCREVTLKAGDIFIRENEVNDQIYIVEAGEVEVYKWDKTFNQNHHIVNLGPNQIVGELSLLDNMPRSASVKAIKPTTLIEFSVSQLKNLPKNNNYISKIYHKIRITKRNKDSDHESPLYSLFLRNMGKSLSTRIRITNEAIVASLRKELAHTKARIIMGNFIITIISVLAIYLSLLTYVVEHQKLFVNSVIVSGPLIVGLAIIVFFYMLKTGLPFSVFGFNLNHWKTSIKESLILSLILIVISFVIKVLAVHYAPFIANGPIFQGYLLTQLFTHKIYFLYIGIYLALVPLQEFIVRGALQTSLAEFLISPYKRFWSIFLSNLLFATTHFHISIKFGALAFFTGLVWGYLYDRNRTLIGVCLSHVIVGLFGVFVLGFEGDNSQ